MKSIILSLVVCLSSAPDQCETRILAADFPTPIACLMAAETEAMRWLSLHPSYRLARWRCGREESSL